MSVFKDDDKFYAFYSQASISQTAGEEVGHMRPGSKNSAIQDRIPGRNYFVCGQGCWVCLRVGPQAGGGSL